MYQEMTTTTTTTTINNKTILYGPRPTIKSSY